MNFNFAQALVEASRLWPDKLFLLTDTEELTFVEVERRSAVVAAWLLGRGCQPGDRLMLQLSNTPEFVIVYFAALRAGMTVVPVNPLLSDNEVLTIVTDCTPKVLVTGKSQTVQTLMGIESATDTLLVLVGDQLAGAIEYRTLESADVAASPYQVVDGGQTAFIIYTSGTTGTPKGAEISHFQALMSCTIEAETLQVSPSDVSLAVLPLFHVFGLSSVLNTAVRKGASVYLMDRFDAERLLTAIEVHKISILAGVPTMYFELLASRRSSLDLSSVRIMISGGAPMPVDVIRQLQRDFSPAQYVEGYGMSESTAAGAINGGMFELKLGSIGRAIWGVEMAVRDKHGTDLAPGREQIGELVMRGPNVMKGYLNRPDATREVLREGWLHTGDLAYQDEEGYFFIVGRAKDLIIRGGYNVHPRDIEEVIYQLEGVRQAAVVGRPDPRLGEEVVAFVLGDRSVLTEEIILDHCKTKLAAYKYPREIYFVDEMPKGNTGKIAKAELVERAQGFVSQE